MSAVKTLRELLSSGTTLVPGASTPLEALLIEQSGFPAIYVSGYAVAGVNYGQPDIGICGRGELVESIRRLSSVVDLPIIADADTGFGDAPGIARTVREYETAGVAAVQIEDQVWPKRCGHMDGKRVVDRATAVGRIVAAVAAKREDTIIIGRTDSIATDGIEEAITRAKLFRDAGAEVLFVDAPEDREQLAYIGRELAGTPLVVNVSEGGKTPRLTLEEFTEYGFGLVLYPSTSARILGASVAKYLTHLREHGTTAGLDMPMWGLDDLNAVVGLSAASDFEDRVRSTATQ